MNIPTSLPPQPPTIFDIFWADISPPNSKMENNLWLGEGVVMDDPRKACRNNKLQLCVMAPIEDPEAITEYDPNKSPALPKGPSSRRFKPPRQLYEIWHKPTCTKHSLENNSSRQ